jgi:hypothetical protein
MKHIKLNIPKEDGWESRVKEKHISTNDEIMMEAINQLIDKVVELERECKSLRVRSHSTFIGNGGLK